MRGNPRAFATMQARLEDVRRSTIPFGFIFTLTQFNLHELAWVAQFAVEQGARLLQVHPQEEVGRARQQQPGARPDQTEAAYAYLEVLRLQASIGERLTIHLDLADRAAVAADPARVFAQPPVADPMTVPLADLISPLVVETDGTVVPLQHGFSRAYALGNLYDASLHHLARVWRAERYVAFQTLCRRVFADLTATPGLPFFNWYEAIGQQSDIAASETTAALATDPVC
jgi:MoaA/NifB/PqqE/SkfB family radical SAM enzyme